MCFVLMGKGRVRMPYFFVIKSKAIAIRYIRPRQCCFSTSIDGNQFLWLCVGAVANYRVETRKRVNEVVQFNLLNCITITHNTRPCHSEEHKEAMVVACTLNVDTMYLVVPRIKGKGSFTSVVAGVIGCGGSHRQPRHSSIYTPPY